MEGDIGSGDIVLEAEGVSVGAGWHAEIKSKDARKANLYIVFMASNYSGN